MTVSRYTPASLHFTRFIRKMFPYLNHLMEDVTQYCEGDKIEKNEMGWACGAYGEGEGGV